MDKNIVLNYLKVTKHKILYIGNKLIENLLNL